MKNHRKQNFKKIDFKIRMNKEKNKIKINVKVNENVIDLATINSYKEKEIVGNGSKSMILKIFCDWKFDN